MYTKIATEYLENFENKEIEKVSKLLCENVSLRDWDAEAFGKSDVVDFMNILFKKVESIDVNILKTYESEMTVVVEMEIFIDGDALLVTDIIDFNEESKISAIRAYLG